MKYNFITDIVVSILSLPTHFSPCMSLPFKNKAAFKTEKNFSVHFDQNYGSILGIWSNGVLKCLVICCDWMTSHQIRHFGEMTDRSISKCRETESRELPCSSSIRNSYVVPQSEPQLPPWTWVSSISSMNVNNANDRKCVIWWYHFCFGFGFKFLLLNIN
jgi:hypothetical protein